MEQQESQAHPLRDTVLTLAGLGVLLALLRMSAAIVAPILLSLFIVAIVSPALRSMRRSGISTGVSLFVGLSALTMLLGGFSILLSRALARFSDALPDYEQLLTARTNEFDSWLAEKNIELYKGGILHHFNPANMVELAKSMVGHLGSVLSDALLILFIVIFMLAETSQFPRKITAVLGSGGPAVPAMAGFLTDLNRYASTKAMVSMVTGVLVWVGLKLLGVNYAELWAFLAFLLNFVPNVGSIIAAVPAVMMAALHGSPLQVGLVVGLYLVVNVGVGNILEPVLVGQRIGLSAVTVLLSLVFWGWMFGIVGMLLSVPLSMAVRSFADAYPPARWLAILMGPAPDEDLGKSS